MRFNLCRGRRGRKRPAGFALTDRVVLVTGAGRGRVIVVDGSATIQM
jgi:hypothetical protein